MTRAPRTREELIESVLDDDAIEDLLNLLKLRVRVDGDVQAARLLLEFRYGRNPEPPNEDMGLAELLLKTPTSLEVLSSE